MSFYSFFRDEKNPLGKTRLWVCRSLACMLRGGEELLDALSARSWASSRATRRRTARSRLEFAECIGACEGRPCVLVNDEHRMNVTPEKADELIAELKR